jgi:hypothetical protein
LRGDHTTTADILVKLERSATFLAVLSPGYVASEWCRDEARLFTQHFTTHVGRRVFVVEKAPLDDAALVPQELTRNRNYRFWYLDGDKQSRTFARPMPQQDEIEYFRQIGDLARDIYIQLRAMRAGPAVQLMGHPVGSSGGEATVFLAEVTDDLEFRRLELRRYLEQQGILVLPETSLPLGRTEFEAALDAELVRSRVFVQLLGPMPGKRPRDVPDGYVWLQLDMARRRGMRVLQWRSPELDLAGIEWPRHRELLELETVQATSLEAFKSAVVAALATPPIPPPSRAMADRPFVFLNTEPRHGEIAAEIRDASVVEPYWQSRCALVRPRT